MKKSFRTYLGGLFIIFMILAFAGIPLVIGSGYLIDTYKLYTQGERIEGTVTTAQSASRSRRRSNAPKYTVAYDQNGDGILESKKFSGPLLSLIQEFNTGDSVTVIQDPNDYENATLDRGKMTWIVPLMGISFLILVGLCMLLGLYALLKSGKLWEEKATSRKNKDHPDR
jgi:hypothetical protein